MFLGVAKAVLAAQHPEKDDIIAVLVPQKLARLHFVWQPQAHAKQRGSFPPLRLTAVVSCCNRQQVVRGWRMMIRMPSVRLDCCSRA